MPNCTHHHGCVTTWSRWCNHVSLCSSFMQVGTVVKEMAGPSTVLSYVFAGFAAILSALCYAEFGARVPKAGSAYTYTYVTIGEIWGFIIGWNIVLEHLLGASSVGRAWSGALDSLFNGAIRNMTLRNVGYLSHGSHWLSEYPDFVAFTVTIIIFAIIGSGAKFTLNFNSLFTIINTIVIIFLVCVGFYFADTKNWSEHGGFMPFGFGGTLAGAATCFYAYIGFEGIAVSGEEARNPEKSIPIATIVALCLVTSMYVLATTSLTLMLPYYLVDPSAAFPVAFAIRGAEWAKYIVACGTLFGITTSLLGSAYSLPRAVYSMASDGLLFRFLAYVHPRFQTPIVAIVIFGLLSALMALLFEITTLVEFMSIGTLTAYTIVSASVIILRYLPVDKCQFKLKPEEDVSTKDESAATEDSSIIKKSKSYDDFGKLKQSLRFLPIIKSFQPGNAVLLAVFLLIVGIICFNATVIFGYTFLASGTWWAIIIVTIFGSLIILCFLVLIAHEKNDAFLTFQIPFVPLIPTASILCNIALMMKLSYLTWIRLGIWLIIGLVLYFSYGWHHSWEHQNHHVEYSQVVSYGEGDMSSNTLSKQDEKIVQLQPNAKEQNTNTKY
ncbi:hypothetical protein ACJMK2_008236 [Sinanodonta woodiana]|uniref:Cationic amino acid transporter C-terminal domain-containing protein n=1 Tax=Sinanodonta woodiana TaxID=1069815 RepID=A0ABD3VKY7_SINWO